PPRLRDGRWQTLKQRCLEKRLLSTLGGHKLAVHGLAFSPDGSRLASACDGGVVQGWGGATSRNPYSFPEGASPVRALAFTRGGESLVTAEWDLTVRVYDTASGRPRDLHQGQREPALRLAVSPDGRRVAASRLGGQVRVVDVPTGVDVHKLRGHDRGAAG